MAVGIKLYWFSPTRSPRALVSEIRQHPASWAALVRPSRPRVSNYGDELSKALIERLTARRVSWARMGNEDLVALGSIIDVYQRQGGVGRIWGSGIADPSLTFDDRIKAQVIAVRGPLTRDRLGLSPSTPLGDPGLLVGTLWPKETREKGLKVLVPHYTVYNSASGRARIDSMVSDGFTVAQPNLTHDEMISLIGRAQFVASSGLHGVILSQALGTPSALISFKDDQREPAFKYKDFFASIDVEPRLVTWTSVMTPAGYNASLEAGLSDLEAGAPGVSALISELELSAKFI